MKKSKIVLIVIISFLVIALAIMTLLYFETLKMAKDNLNQVLNAANETFEANKRIHELEDELNSYKNSSVTENTTNSINKTASSEPYIPEDMPVENSNDNSEIKASDIKFNRKPENVTIKVLEDTVTNESVEILITDNNEDSYGWGKSFRLQKKVNNVWKDVEPTNDLIFESIGYNLDSNKQLTLKVNYGKYYGTQKTGTYRIVKTVYDNEYIDLFSNEFKIK